MYIYVFVYTCIHTTPRTWPHNFISDCLKCAKLTSSNPLGNPDGQ